MKNRPNWLLRLAAVLLVLVLFTTHIVTGLFAKFTTADSGSDSARVAKFLVSELAEGINAPLGFVFSPTSSSQKQVISVTNDSEVAVRIAVATTSTGNLPLVISDPAARVLAPGDTEKFTVQISWQAGENDYTYNSEIDHLSVTIDCRQVD